jgi:hypothetical protein
VDAAPDIDTEGEAFSLGKLCFGNPPVDSELVDPEPMDPENVDSEAGDGADGVATIVVCAVRVGRGVEAIGPETNETNETDG